MDYKKTLITSILAGFFIGIGGLIFLSVENKVVGAALFSIGLFVVLTMNLSLFTGKICYVLEGNRKQNIVNILVVWIGNFLGSWILAFLLSNTRGYSQIKENAYALCQTKLNDSYISLFILGFLCNIFIFIAVDEYRNNEHILGKYVAIFLGVMGFILAGTEHCVADMFYVNIAHIYRTDMISRLLIITLGNTVGGICSMHFLKKAKAIE